MRNIFTKDDWVLESVSDFSVCITFDCGDDDINDYFRKDVCWHKEELICHPYALYQVTEPDFHLAFLDFCNDSIKLKYLKETIDPKIHYQDLPAVKLTRIGVVKDFRNKNVGTQAMNMVKEFFKTDNRTGCRFITVDANQGAIGFYEKNGFALLTDKDKNKDSRAMYFDLKRFVLPSESEP